jgi:glycerol-3-phosphate O-acyltransferase
VLLWVRSETINQSSLTLNLDRSRPVFYALPSPSLTDLAVIDHECTKRGCRARYCRWRSARCRNLPGSST